MRTTAPRSAAVILAAALAGLAVWAVAQLAGVDLTVQLGEPSTEVGPVDVLLASVAAGLAAWVVQSALARSPRTARWWPFVGSSAIAVSMTGPSYLADGAAAVALICMHLAVGIVLVWGLSPAALVHPQGRGRAEQPDPRSVP